MPRVTVDDLYPIRPPVATEPDDIEPADLAEARTDLIRRVVNRRDRIEGPVPPEYALVLAELEPTAIETDEPLVVAVGLALVLVRADLAWSSILNRMLASDAIDLAIRIARVEIAKEARP